MTVILCSVLCVCGGGGDLHCVVRISIVSAVCMCVCLCVEVGLADLCGSQCCQAWRCALVRLHTIHDGLLARAIA